MRLFFVMFLLFYFKKSSFSQSLKYTFFDFKQDSLRSRQTQISVPVQAQTMGISNSLIADYVGNTRISVGTSIIASRKDTFLAIHSLFNGIGNFTIESETPIFCLPFKHNNVNFFGASFNPKASTLVNTGSVFEKSTLNVDAGFNLILKVQGDLGTMSAKFIFRNAFTWGNYQFVEKIYGVNTKLFFYNTFQIRIKAQNNVFIINAPLMIHPLKSKEITGFPVYAGLGFSF